MPTKYLETDVEGTSYDILVAIKFALDSNPSISDIFNGIPILKTPISDKIYQIWLKSYKPEKLAHAYKG